VSLTTKQLHLSRIGSESSSLNRYYTVNRLQTKAKLGLLISWR